MNIIYPHHKYSPLIYNSLRMSIISAALIPKVSSFKTNRTPGLMLAIRQSWEREKFELPHAASRALSHIAAQTQHTVSKSECLLTFTHTAQKP